jgi:hypothetical protein
MINSIEDKISDYQDKNESEQESFLKEVDGLQTQLSTKIDMS